jgi:tripartite-type tricarboxylate transporter receptor subunit TctC
MNTWKHRGLRTTAGLLLSVASLSAVAQTWPQRPIRLIQGFAVGGNSDAIARVLGTELGKALGQPVVVEARTGAGGPLASDAVARAAPDGHTLLMATGGHAVTGALYKSLSYKPVVSYEWIGQAVVFPFVVAVRSDSPHATLAQLIATAKAKPKALNFGSAGIGSTQHLVGELLASQAGVQLMHVPYKGEAAALVGLLGGELDAIVAGGATVLPQLKGGKIRVLAVSSGARWSALPDVPTAGQAGVPGFDVASWASLAAPAGTPVAVVQRLQTELNKALQLPEVRTRLEALGGDVHPETPARTRERVASDLQRWKRVVEEARIELPQ